MQVQIWDLDVTNKDVDILGVAEFELAALVKAGQLEKELKDPTGSKKAGILTMTCEEDIVSNDIVHLEAEADLKAVGAGCCGAGDHPQLIIQR